MPPRQLRLVPEPDLYCRRVMKAKQGQLRLERLEKRLGLFQVGSVEAFGKPTVDGSEEITPFDVPSLVTPKSGEAHGGAQFPELGPLPLGDAQGFAIQLLCDLG